MHLTNKKYILATNKEILGSSQPQTVLSIPELFKGTISGMKYEPHNALDMLFDSETKEMLKTKGGGRSGVIFASGASEWAGASLTTTHLKPLHNYNIPFMALINIIAGKYANMIGWHGYISSDATSCISSYKAIQEAKFLLDSGRLDRVMIVGIDDQINESTLNVFGTTGASLKLSEEEKGIKPSAFDSINHSFYIGHGFGFCVFEREKTNESIAEVLSIEIGAEQNMNPLGQRLDGKGYSDVMFKSLQYISEEEKNNITFIKTHGTGTKSNNEAESNALKTVFGENFIATSYKPEIGHTMGASGILELCIAIDDAKKNIIRGIKNKTIKDDKFISYDIKKEIKNIMLLGSGMGNVYASLIVKNYK